MTCPDSQDYNPQDYSHISTFIGQVRKGSDSDHRLTSLFVYRNVVSLLSKKATSQQCVLYLAGCTDLAFTANLLRFWHECPRPEVQDKDGVSCQLRI